MVIAGISEIYASNNQFNAPEQWEIFSHYLGKISAQKNNVAYGLCYILDNNKGIEYICGVEVTDTDNLPGTFVHKEVPEHTYVVFIHNGHVSALRKTLDKIAQNWAPSSGYEKPDGENFFFERYGEKFDPTTGLGDIEIWIPVKE